MFSKQCTRNILNFNSKLSIAFLSRQCSITVSGAKSGYDGFTKDFETCHLEISQFQKAFLGIGSAVFSLADPKRGDMIAAMGETTGDKSLECVRNKMLESKEGSRILAEKPRINSKSVDLHELAKLKEGTVGKTYYNFMSKYGYSPDARLAVRFIDDIELAYVIQRYREVHDLFHSILRMPTNMLGEVTVKWIEGVQTRFPMCYGGALFGATRLAPKYSRRMFSTASKPQVILESSVQESLAKEEFKPKKHPGVMTPPCVVLPEPIQKTIADILESRSIGDVVEKGNKLSHYLHSRKPPMEVIDLEMKRKQIYEQVVAELSQVPDFVENLDQEVFDKLASSNVEDILWKTTYNWKQLKMDETMSLFYLAGRAVPEYAAIARVFNEIYRRDPSFCPKTLFDFGSGVGTVSWAANSIWGSSIKEYFTVDSSAAANDLALLVLQHNKPEASPFIKTLFQRQFLPATPRQYDLVISAYSLMEMPNMKGRLEVMNNLWNKSNKYLVLIEHGSNAAFELLNEAKSFITYISEKSNVKCHVFAPCSHDLGCPKLAEKLPCNFPVKYSPLSHQQFPKVVTSKFENFSFLILAKGERSENDPHWPRVVSDVLRRHHHTICRLCTSKGKLEEIILTRSKHGKDIYKCSWYSSWGDLLPFQITNTENTSSEK